MCWINGKIHSADIFANHMLFDGSYSKLLKSYALDVQLEQKPKPIPVDSATCRKFLAEILTAKRSVSERSRSGNLYKLKDGKIQGYESGGAAFGGGVGGGGGGAGYGHGTYKPGGP